MDCSPPDSSVHGILQARILEWVAISSLGGLPNPGIEPTSALAGRFFTTTSVQFSSVAQLNSRSSPTPITNSRRSLRLTSIESVMPSSHLILCRPLLLLPPIPPSIRVFSDESTLLMRWPKYWSFSFSSIPSKEHPGLISFRMDWLDLLAVQGTLKSPLQHHIQKHQFFSTQLSSQFNSHIHT